VTNLRIAPLAPIHAREAARLHIQGQPGTFLTSLGEDVLAVIYRALPQSAGGFGFAAEITDGLAGASLGGYVSATLGIGGLFVEMGSKRLGELLPPLLRRYGQEPRLVWRSVQTALYPFLMHDEAEAGPAAELLSIMVQPERRSHGVGALLMAALLQECANRSIPAIVVTVDAANEGAQRFYRRHGFAEWRTITLYGRSMLILRRTVTG
jgi:ribosomal protein S18 acetylase RimI-like enzyme